MELRSQEGEAQEAENQTGNNRHTSQGKPGQAIPPPKMPKASGSAPGEFKNQILGNWFLWPCRLDQGSGSTERSKFLLAFATFSKVLSQLFGIRHVDFVAKKINHQLTASFAIHGLPRLFAAQCLSHLG
jgi:hypothetical protein